MIRSTLVAVVMLALSGCASVDEREPGQVSVPWPALGARASYEGDIAFDLSVDGITEVRDASGVLVQTLSLVIKSQYEDEEDFSQRGEYVDREGSKALVAAPCIMLGLGIYPDPDDCVKERKPSASWMEHGLPGALGASWLWGRTLTTSGIERDALLLGDRFPIRYEAEQVPGEASCLALSRAQRRLPVAPLDHHQHAREAPCRLRQKRPLQSRTMRTITPPSFL